MHQRNRKPAAGTSRAGSRLAFIVLAALLAVAAWTGPAIRAAHAAAPADTTYHKWSLIAIEETKQKYPKAALVDYLHIGRTQLGGGLSEERFKLWLREDRREFGVYVNVRFRDAENRLISVAMRETGV
ncbi:DUF3889 domain-containing protein [Cohnella sp. JJ-181]|uniref:DUF3889 domain-containing protein n=1 Tax=Cohnella rhizoplanae TaxID=2974897 RepID=UPI0022FFA1F8|nr:DUF3889 domain-containing protein [Cohnella sp. JJ-181]CAI6081605.1 hypothetical protein COHCIP112018_03366 [Cohnella sp. JJ-181]